MSPPRPLPRQRSPARTPVSGVVTGRSTTDDELVARVVAGDLASFEPLMRRHNQLLFRVARGIVVDDDEAEDVVQQTYVMAYLNLAKFSVRSRLSTWLTRIAIHEALGRKRKQRRETPSDDASWSPRAGGRGPDDELAARELLRLLESRIDALPELQRLVFLCRDVQGLSTSETADSLEVSEGHVRVTLHRARRDLRASLGPEIGEMAPDAFHFAGQRCDRIVASVLARLGRGLRQPS